MNPILLKEEEKNLKTIRQYMINNYLLCPRLFKLCQEFEAKQTEAMLKGRIFESILFGFKSVEDEKEMCLTKTGKPRSCVSNYKRIAEKLKHIFINGENHNRIFIKINGEYQLSFEPDYVGKFIIQHTGEEVEAIVDLKLTADINKIWDYKSKKDDFFQAVSYTWAVWIKTGVFYPFYYFVVEDNEFETPVYRLIEVVITHNDLEWFIKLAKTAVNDIFLEPNANHCLGSSKFDPRCRSIEKCDFGRNKIGGFERFIFSDLSSDFEPDLSGSFEDVTNVKSKTYMDLPATEELEETRFDDIEKGLFKQITMLRSEKRENGYRCRNCRTVAIQDDDQECPNCKAKIMWLED